MRKLLVISVGAVAVIAAIVLSIPVNKRIHAQAGFRRVRPYQIWYTESGTSTYNSNNVTQVSYFVGQNENGDSVRIPDGKTLRMLRLFSQGISVQYSPDYHTKTTTGTGKPSPGPYYGDNCEGLPGQTGETRTLLGLQTLHILEGSIDSVGGRRDYWVAPLLNCQPLLDVTDWKDANGSSNSTRVATKAIGSAPDASLFAIPADALEQNPATFYPSVGMTTPPRLESVYEKQRAQRATPRD